MKVFIVEVMSKLDGVIFVSKISSEGYTSLRKAHEFIATRVPTPMQINPMYWTSDECGFRIHEIDII